MRVSVTALAFLVVALTAVPGAAATPTPAPSPTRHAVPPKAPQPTSDANSPDAPDPNPPRGGIGPFGEPVGGRRMLSRGQVLPAHAPALPNDLTAQGWVLFDLDSGAILAARDPHGRYQPASCLKVFTAATLIPLLPGHRTVRASAAAANTEGSHAGVWPHGRYTVDQLFRGLLLVSGNDAAATLAEAAGGVQHTVALMNRTALSLGAYDTYVETPSGLDGWKQLTSAYDMAVFLRAAVALPRFVGYARTPQVVMPAQHTDYGSTGAVVDYNQNEQFLTTVPGALVAKTGYTDAAQHTFVGVIARQHRRLGVVFMRAQRWPLDQWQQAVELVNWGLALPRHTAPVGHLDPAVVPQASATRSASRAAARRGSVRTAAAGKRGGGGDQLWLGLGAGAVAALGASGVAWRRRRTRHSTS